ncbi:MAG: hypothetical protein ACREO8_10970 [Luteimonas sp.]
MSKLKTSLLVVVSAAAVLSAASASAVSFEVWNGSAWVANGVSHFTGPTTASYLGNSLPCSADFTFNVAAGVATVTAASFSGNPTCTSIVSRGLPWTVTIGSGNGSSYGLTIGGTSTTTIAGGVNIFIPAPLNANCPGATSRGPVSGTLVNPTGTPPAATGFTFSGTLGPCAVSSNPRLAASPAIRVIP